MTNRVMIDMKWYVFANATLSLWLKLKKILNMGTTIVPPDKPPAELNVDMNTNDTHPANSMKYIGKMCL